MNLNIVHTVNIRMCIS